MSDDQERQHWTGASGKKYEFYVYPRHPEIERKQMGNYIYAKLNQNGAWVPVYIGMGDLSVRCSTNHHQSDCIDAKGATHVHLRLTATEDERRAIERDLLARFANAYAPTGCNVKVGG